MKFRLKYLLKGLPLYVRISINHIEVIHLDTGHSVAFDAKVPFSNDRNVIANFAEAEMHMRAVIKELLGTGLFSPNLRVLAQQMELCEGGLSEVEKRTIRDSCEHAGAKWVRVVDHNRPLDIEQARRLAEEMTPKA